MLVHIGDLVRFKIKDIDFKGPYGNMLRQQRIMAERAIVQKEDKDCFEPHQDIAYDYGIRLKGDKHKWEGQECLAIVSSEPELLDVSLGDLPLYEVQVTRVGDACLPPEFTLNSFQFEVVSETQDPY